MTFKELAIGETFDWVNPQGLTYNSFFKRCTKIDRFRYVAEGEDGVKYRVGSLKTTVYHVGGEG